MDTLIVRPDPLFAGVYLREARPPPSRAASAAFLVDAQGAGSLFLSDGSSETTFAVLDSGGGGAALDVAEARRAASPSAAAVLRGAPLATLLTPGAELFESRRSQQWRAALAEARSTLSGAASAAVSARAASALQVSATGSGPCLGLGAVCERSTGFCLLAPPLAYSPATPFTVRCIAAGDAHVLAATTSGAAFAWGSNRAGALGLGVFGGVRSQPVAVLPLCGQVIAAVAAGRNHSLWLSAEGAVFAAGEGGNGQLGCGDKMNRRSPTAPGFFAQAPFGRRSVRAAAAFFLADPAARAGAELSASAAALSPSAPALSARLGMPRDARVPSPLAGDPLSPSLSSSRGRSGAGGAPPPLLAVAATLRLDAMQSPPPRSAGDGGGGGGSPSTESAASRSAPGMHARGGSAWGEERSMLSALAVGSATARSLSAPSPSALPRQHCGGGGGGAECGDSALSPALGGGAGALSGGQSGAASESLPLWLTASSSVASPSPSALPDAGVAGEGLQSSPAVASPFVIAGDASLVDDGGRLLRTPRSAAPPPTLSPSAAQAALAPSPPLTLSPAGSSLGRTSGASSLPTSAFASAPSTPGSAGGGPSPVASGGAFDASASALTFGPWATPRSARSEPTALLLSTRSMSGGVADVDADALADLPVLQLAAAPLASPQLASPPPSAAGGAPSASSNGRAKPPLHAVASFFDSSSSAGRGGEGGGGAHNSPHCTDAAADAPAHAPLLLSGIAAGGDASFALTSDGRVYAWGCSAHGRSGTGRTADIARPLLMQDLRQHAIVQVSAGETHTLFVTAEGRLFACGNGAFGRLGVGADERDRHAPVQVGGALAGRIVRRAAAGVTHSLAVTADGGIFAFGDNAALQLGVAALEEDGSAGAAAAGALSAAALQSLGSPPLHASATRSSSGLSRRTTPPARAAPATPAAAAAAPPGGIASSASGEALQQRPRAAITPALRSPSVTSPTADVSPAPTAPPMTIDIESGVAANPLSVSPPSPASIASSDGNFDGGSAGGFDSRRCRPLDANAGAAPLELAAMMPFSAAAAAAAVDGEAERRISALPSPPRGSGGSAAPSLPLLLRGFVAGSHAELRALRHGFPHRVSAPQPVQLPPPEDGGGSSGDCGGSGVFAPSLSGVAAISRRIVDVAACARQSFALTAEGDVLCWGWPDAGNAPLPALDTAAVAALIASTGRGSGGAGIDSEPLTLHASGGASDQRGASAATLSEGALRAAAAARALPPATCDALRAAATMCTQGCLPKPTLVARGAAAVVASYAVTLLLLRGPSESPPAEPALALSSALPAPASSSEPLCRPPPHASLLPLLFLAAAVVDGGGDAPLAPLALPRLRESDQVSSTLRHAAAALMMPHGGGSALAYALDTGAALACPSFFSPPVASALPILTGGEAASAAGAEDAAAAAAVSAAAATPAAASAAQALPLPPLEPAAVAAACASASASIPAALELAPSQAQAGAASLDPSASSPAVASLPTLLPPTSPPQSAAAPPPLLSAPQTPDLPVPAPLSSRVLSEAGGSSAPQQYAAAATIARDGADVAASLAAAAAAPGEAGAAAAAAATGAALPSYPAHHADGDVSAAVGLRESRFNSDESLDMSPESAPGSAAHAAHGHGRSSPRSGSGGGRVTVFVARPLQEIQDAPLPPCGFWARLAAALSGGCCTSADSVQVAR